MEYCKNSENSASKGSANAFTIIELLSVVAVVVVLVGITFGVTKGVNNQQARTKARAELAMIAQALEEFKLTYGDYPISSQGDAVTTSNNAQDLLLALTGFAYLEAGTAQGTKVMTEVDSGKQRKSFIDVDRMNLINDFGIPTSPNDLDNNYLIDPWRQPYVYVYNNGSSTSSWDNFGYVLFSKGPDGTADEGVLETQGILNESSDNNIDNIYLN